jgi:hypothetical protein
MISNLRSIVALGLVLILTIIGTTHAAPICTEPSNLVVNGSFEQGFYSWSGIPDGWFWNAYTPVSLRFCDDTISIAGDRSVGISSPSANDAFWFQPIVTKRDTLYYLSGWVRTKDVAPSPQIVNAGANLSLLDTFVRSPAILGTQEWTKTGLLFNSQYNDHCTIAARLGFYAGTTTGSAWFDDVKVTQVVPVDPHPRWNILVLIYRDTDFTYFDRAGTQHHVVASMTQDEAVRASDEARLFVEQDIPALTSSNMLPRLTVRYPEKKLTTLAPNGSGWWPAPENTIEDRDPAFDSVIVIWDPRTKDQSTGQSIWIGSAAGLTLSMGTGQTYTAIIVEAAISYDHRNVFKHEWGHSITDFYNSAGSAPKPMVQNHAVATDYVNCLTGAPYVWQDETLSNPIANSIYNNESGFTHDYYSGTTARASDPTKCIGVSPEAWALGGPVSHSGSNPVFTPTQRVLAIIDQLEAIKISGQLDAGAMKLLNHHLELALAQGEKGMARHLEIFVKHLESLSRKEQIQPSAAELLTNAANAAVACLNTLLEKAPVNSRR